LTSNSIDPKSASLNAVPQNQLFKAEQIQQILEENYDALQVLVQASPLAIIELSSDGIVRKWNSAAEYIFGWEREEVLGRLFLLAHQHKDKQEEFLYLREQILNSKKLVGAELHYQKKDGSPIDIDIFTVHNTTSIAVIIDDVTKYKPIERRLKTQYAVTRILAESITLGEAIAKVLEVICKCFEWEISAFWKLDPNINVLRNIEIWHIPSIKLESFYEVTKRITFSPGIGLPGRVWENCSPLWITDLSKDTKFLRLPVAVREGLRSGFGFPILVMGEFFGVVDSYSREFQKPDQNVLDMLTTFGSQIGQFIERRQAEKALQESEKKYRSLVGNIPAITWTSTQDKKPIFISSNIVNVYGFTSEEIYQQNEKHWVERTHPKDIERVKIAYKSLFSENRVYDVEYRIQRKDGKWIWIHDKAVATYIKDGVIYADGLFSDITKRKKTQKRLQISSRQQAIIVQLGQRALAGTDIHLLMNEAVTALAQILDVDLSSIWELLPGDKAILLKVGNGWERGLVGKLKLELEPDYFSNKVLLDAPIIIKNLPEETQLNIPPSFYNIGVVSGLCIPIVWLRQPFGLLSVFTRKKQEFTKSDINFFQAIANVTAAAIGRKWAEENRTQLLSQIFVAQEKERKWIARELHDETGQSLTALLVGLKVIEIAQTLEDAQTQASFLRDIASQTVKNIKRLSQGLHPNTLEDLGLVIALNRYITDYMKSYGIDVKVTTKKLAEHFLSTPIEIALYRIVQEALTNIAKHAQAKKVKIAINGHPSYIQLRIIDDGCGFNVESTLRTAVISKRLGLYGMSERVNLLGGTITIKSKEGKGTNISIQIPTKFDNSTT
jgi:PAS domain S-box-containing protein